MTDVSAHGVSHSFNVNIINMNIYINIDIDVNLLGLPMFVECSCGSLYLNGEGSWDLCRMSCLQGSPAIR